MKAPYLLVDVHSVAIKHHVVANVSHKLEGVQQRREQICTAHRRDHKRTGVKGQLARAYTRAT